MSTFELKPYDHKNIATVLSIRNAENVRRNSLDSEVISRESHLSFLNSLGKTSKRGYFVVFYNSILAGTINLSIVNSGAYWGCALHPEAQNIPGLFIGFVLLAGQISFENTGLEFLQSEIIHYNSAPIKVNSYLGIPLTYKESKLRNDGEKVDVLQYCLKHKEWPSVKARAARLVPKAMFEAASANSTLLNKPGLDS